ncbi:tyrosine-type recombinase/integrase [Amylibacter sp.]|nr:tyrosine-type recombinase/integrase [Amylibacter sp.]
MFKLPPYVEKKNTDGIYRYRRRIPAKLVEIVGKVRFYRNLGRGKYDIVSNWTTVHREYEALIAQAKDTLALQQEMSAEAKAEYEIKSERDKVLFLVEQHYGKEASEMLAVGQVDDDFYDALEGLSQELSGKISRKTEAMISSGKVPEFVHTVATAIGAYYKYKTTGIPETDKRLHNRLMANKRNLIKCWGAVKVEKTPIEQLTRRDANAYRDFLLQTTKPSSVSRNISTVNASINWNTREHALDTVSIFANMEIKNSAHTKDDRHPLTDNEVRQVNGVMKDTTVWPLWVMMRDLGMRTAEVSGLLVGDISLQNRTLDIKANAIRRIKTDGSERTLPISAEMIKLLQPYRQGKDDDEPLFDRYGSVKGAGNASSAMRKHFQKVVSNKKKTPYSARHTLKDALRNSGCDSELIDAIYGHAGKTVGSRYGLGFNTDIMRDALEKVWK